MFTGLIQKIGEIAAVELTPQGGRLTIALEQLPPDIQIGESIAVDGCCLTVTDMTDRCLIFDVSDETMRKTTFSSAKKGVKVNVERALAASDRLGGHFVLGHVDGVGQIEKKSRHEGSLELEISFPKNLKTLLVDKGSVTVDGVSLTVCALSDNRFSVFLIPETVKRTNLGNKVAGDPVNLEGDVLGKYVRNLILMEKSSSQETADRSQNKKK